MAVASLAVIWGRWAVFNKKDWISVVLPIEQFDGKVVEQSRWAKPMMASKPFERFLSEVAGQQNDAGRPPLGTAMHGV